MGAKSILDRNYKRLLKGKLNIYSENSPNLENTEEIKEVFKLPIDQRSPEQLNILMY